MRKNLKSASVLAIGLVLAFSVAGCGRENPVRTVFMVEGMHCDGCSSAITEALLMTDGVEEASADHEKGVAEAVYQPSTVDVEELKAEIEKLGYTVTSMETEAVEG
jgi:copper chaperone CopZ